jgi:hypothetical protein
VIDTDNLVCFNTILNVINVFKNSTQEETQKRIEHKLDLLLAERIKNENNKRDIN